MKLGSVAKQIFLDTHTLDATAGAVFHALGIFIGLILWSFGLAWLFFAIATIVRSRNFPFNIGWWGFTFPLGTYAVCTMELGRQLSSKFFEVLGTVSPVPFPFGGLALQAT